MIPDDSPLATFDRYLKRVIHHEGFRFVLEIKDGRGVQVGGDARTALARYVDSGGSDLEFCVFCCQCEKPTQLAEYVEAQLRNLTVQARSGKLDEFRDWEEDSKNWRGGKSDLENSPKRSYPTGIIRERVIFK